MPSPNVKESLSDRRKRQRHATATAQEVKLSHLNVAGVTIVVPARLVESHERGCSVETNQPLEVGVTLTVTGPLGGRPDQRVRGQVAWCRLRSIRSHRVGIEFLEPVQQANGHTSRGTQASPAGAPLPEDYYEALQLSPKADLDTVHRVYRLLAQRYHPDNSESGNAERFRQVLEAYRVLSDPEKRAAYDATYEQSRQARWHIFDQGTTADEFAAEKAKRQGILGLLYRKRVATPAQPGITVQEFEDLLGVPREHLEFTLWYLKERGYVLRADNGRYAVTVGGIDCLEAIGGAPRQPGSALLLPAATRHAAA